MLERITKSVSNQNTAEGSSLAGELPRQSITEKIAPVAFAEAIRIAPRLTVGALAVVGTIMDKMPRK